MEKETVRIRTIVCPYCLKQSWPTLSIPKQHSITKLKTELVLRKVVEPVKKREQGATLQTQARKAGADKLCSPDRIF